MAEELSKDPSSSLIKTYKAELILLAVTFSWGLSFPLIKISLGDTSPALFIFIRFAVTLLIFLFLYKNKMDFSRFEYWKYGLVLGIFLFAGFAFQTVGLKYTTASKSAFITATNLIIIPFAQYFIVRLRPKPENIIGAIIVLTGLYILSETYFTIPNTGDILTFICALAFALHIVYLDKFSHKIHFNYLIYGQFLMMVTLSLLYMVVFEIFLYNDIRFTLTLPLIGSLLYTSIVSTMITIILMTKYQKKTTPLRAGIIYSMESIFAVFFAYIILGEILNFNQVMGALIMFTGLLISEFYGFLKIKLTNAGNS